MTAILLITLFAGAALLALSTMAVSWRQWGAKFAQARSELRNADHRVGVRFQWRGTAAPRASALVYQLKFTPQAEGLPFHPELGRELRVAA
jgi:hypothetical protein